MVSISEFLPNPAGSDANEWIELHNDGALAVNVSGWRIETGNGGFDPFDKLRASKKTFLSGTISPSGYRVFYKKDYKFTLRNIDENITLYDARGVVIDRAGFSGQAISGKSYSRQPSGSFIVTDPTPGAKNIGTSALALINNSLPYNRSISPSIISAGEIALLCLGAGVLCAGVSLYIIKNLHVDISRLFFARDEKIRDDSREEASPEPAEGTIPF